MSMVARIKAFCFGSTPELFTCRKCKVTSEYTLISCPSPKWWPNQTDLEYQRENQLVRQFALCEYCQYGVER